MMLVLYVFLIFIGLLLAQEIFRRFPKFALVVFLILPIILAPYWAENGIKDWFLWAKVFSISAFAILFLILKIRNIGENRLAKILLYLFLVVNMLEAIIKDISGGNVEHYLNAIAGILLIITLRDIDSISITKDKFRDVVWDRMTLMWIVGYTIWNWTFVYMNLVNFSAENLAVIGAPLVAAFFNKGRWLQARVFTLATYLIFFYSFYDVYPNMSSSYWANDFFSYYLAEAVLIFMIVYAIFFLRSCDSRLNKIKKLF